MCAPSEAWRLESRSWGPDDDVVIGPSAFRLVTPAPVLGIAIGERSEVGSALLSIGGRTRVVSVGRPFAGLVPVGSVVRPAPTAGITAAQLTGFGVAQRGYLELVGYSSLPHELPRARAPRPYSGTASFTIGTASMWVGGARSLVVWMTAPAAANTWDISAVNVRTGGARSLASGTFAASLTLAYVVDLETDPCEVVRLDAGATSFTYDAEALD